MVEIRLKGKVAFVTGAGSGIGRAIALGMGREGGAVVVADINLPSARSAASELDQAGARALALELDVSDPKSVKAGVHAALAEFGQVDILINNAGVISSVPVLAMPEDEWDRILNTNLKGVLLCSQSVAPSMIERGKGTIINMSSVAAEVPTPDYAHYGASKAAILHLTRSLAVALGRYGIRVNAIQPGTILSPMNAAALSDPDVMAERVKLIPLGRVGRLDEVVSAALFLASDEASYITGESLHVDGGNILLR